MITLNKLKMFAASLALLSFAMGPSAALADGEGCTDSMLPGCDMFCETDECYYHVCGDCATGACYGEYIIGDGDCVT